MGNGIKAPMKINLMPKNQRKVNLVAALRAAKKLKRFHLEKECQLQDKVIKDQQELIDLYKKYFNFMERRYPVSERSS